MKTIIVACGSGIATSSLVGGKIKNLLAERGIDVNIESININNLDHYKDVADVFISIVNDQKTDYFNVPTFSGIPFLLGQNTDEELEKIINCLKKG